MVPQGVVRLLELHLEYTSHGDAVTPGREELDTLKPIDDRAPQEVVHAGHYSDPENVRAAILINGNLDRAAERP